MLCHISSFRRRPLVLALAAIAATASTAALAGPAAPHLFTDKGIARDAELPSHAKLGSGRVVALSKGALGAGLIELTTPDGLELAATRTHTSSGRFDSETWVGSFDDSPGSLLVVTQRGSTVAGMAQRGDQTFEISTDARGVTHFYEVDESRLPPYEPDTLEAVNAGADDASALLDATAATGGSAADGQVLDLMVVYTPKAASTNGQSALEAMIVSAVESANQAYRNSGIGIYLNLVHMAEVNYSESGDLTKTIAALRATNDGQMDEVHTWRDKYGADLVSIISEDTNYCGYGYIMTSESVNFASSAFTAVRSRCLSSQSLAHEIGHNQGNNHNRENANQYVLFPYAYGWRRCVTDGTGFRTVMSYSCSGAPRVLQFSNPNVYYNGYPTGVSYESDPSHSADVARSMNNTADTVSMFRSGSTGSTTPATPPSAPTSLGASAISDTRIDLAWTDTASDETGFRVERSPNGVDWSEIATVGTNVESYANTGLSASTSYSYRVRAYNSNGSSAYSNVAGATTLAPAPPPPTAPSNVAAVLETSSEVMVSWADSSTTESGFDVGRQQLNTKNGTWSSITVVGQVAKDGTWYLETVGPGTYRYEVRAYNSGGSSKWVASGDVSVASTSTTSTKKGNGKGRGRSGKKGGK